MTTEEVIEMLEAIKEGLSNNEIRSNEKLDRDVQSKRFYDSEIAKYSSLIEENNATIDRLRNVVATAESEIERLNGYINDWEELREEEFVKNSDETISDPERIIHGKNIENLKKAIESTKESIVEIRNSPTLLAEKETIAKDYQSKLEEAQYLSERFNSVLMGATSSLTIIRNIDSMIDGIKNNTMSLDEIRANMENYLNVELANIYDTNRYQEMDNLRDVIIPNLNDEINALEEKLSNDNNYASSIFETIQFEADIRNLAQQRNELLIALASYDSALANINNDLQQGKNVNDELVLYTQQRNEIFKELTEIESLLNQRREQVSNPVRAEERNKDIERLGKIKNELVNAQARLVDLDFDVKSYVEALVEGLKSNTIQSPATTDLQGNNTFSPIRSSNQTIVNSPNVVTQLLYNSTTSLDNGLSKWGPLTEEEINDALEQGFSEYTPGDQADFDMFLRSHGYDPNKLKEEFDKANQVAVSKWGPLTEEEIMDALEQGFYEYTPGDQADFDMFLRSHGYDPNKLKEELDRNGQIMSQTEPTLEVTSEVTPVVNQQQQLSDEERKKRLRELLSKETMDGAALDRLESTGVYIPSKIYDSNKKEEVQVERDPQKYSRMKELLNKLSPLQNPNNVKTQEQGGMSM